MLALHRIGGYLFGALFCVMSYFMAARLRSGGVDNSTIVNLHLALAMILSLLMFIKVFVARYYRNQHGLLMPSVFRSSCLPLYLSRAHRGRIWRIPAKSSKCRSIRRTFRQRPSTSIKPAI
jgi:hypothetical protein